MRTHRGTGRSQEHALRDLELGAKFFEVVTGALLQNFERRARNNCGSIIHVDVDSDRVLA